MGGGGGWGEEDGGWGVEPCSLVVLVSVCLLCVPGTEAFKRWLNRPPAAAFCCFLLEMQSERH